MTFEKTSKIPILTYHSIDSSGSVISTHPETFRCQMKFLSENNFNVISLKTFVEHHYKNKQLPLNSIILTFDDGFQNFYTTAFPVLQDYNFTATVFLITDYCGKFNDWSGNLPSLECRKLMDWAEIKELSNHNIEFGAHSLTHPNLTKLSLQATEREIVESKLAIESQLGVEISDFAYPYGIFNSAVKLLTQKHFKTACSTRMGKVTADYDSFALKRLDSYYLSNEKIFGSILSDKFDWYIGFRQIIRDFKSVWYSV